MKNERINEIQKKNEEKEKNSVEGNSIKIRKNKNINKIKEIPNKEENIKSIEKIKRK